MKNSSLRSLLAASLLFLPTLAFAHPGHDGEHDFGWDFDHFASHPLATLACAAVVVAGGWAVWRLLNSAASRPKTDRVKR